MTNIPSSASYVQIESTEAYSPVSESTLFAAGASVNFLLDHFPVQPGTIHDFFGLESSLPPGYIICDGRAVSRTGANANLFAVTGTLGGIGDGITTFNVPDLRGYFTRMVDLTSAGQANHDPDHATRTPIGTGTSEQAGSFEDESFKSHTHNFDDVQTPGNGAQIGTVRGGPQQTGAAGGNETRPKNIYVIKMIKI